MRVRFARFACFLLALTVALTSVTMALARGQARDATGAIVICTGAGAVAMQVDANGNPVGPVHLCPDCMIDGLDLAGAFSVHSALVPLPSRIGFHFDAASTVGAAPRDPQSRGPPSA